MIFSKACRQLSLASALLGAAGNLLAGPFWTDNRLSGTGAEALPFEGERVFAGLELVRPTALVRWPGKSEKPRQIVVTQDGLISSFEERDGVTEMAPFLDLRAKPGEGNMRLYDLAFDPAWPEKLFVYVAGNHVKDKVGRSGIWRFDVAATAPGAAPQVLPESKLEILHWASRGHDGCDLAFGPEGFLYASTGDGQAPADPANTGQKTDDLLGSVLRLDVSASTKENPYRIPEDNPFAHRKDGVRGEIWAYGLRNPWKMAFHPTGGQLLLGDNGDEHWELVRHITAGTNHGWSAFEGRHLFRVGNELEGPVKELTLPVAEHSHQVMRSVVGGRFYAGKEHGHLKGRYLYGDYVMRSVWSFAWDEKEGQVIGEPRQLAQLPSTVVAFGEDSKGEPLILGYDGMIHRLVAAPERQTLAIPATLSATGLFSETGKLKPAEGVLSYSIRAESWSDGESKLRHVAVPEGTGLIDAHKGDGQKKSWEFPDGSAFAQTFVNPEGQKVETQVMHRDGFQWKYLSYRWREDQKDAELVPAEGLVTEGGRRFLSRAECAVCHTQRTFFLLAAGSGQIGHEIEAFEKAGWFKPKRGPKPERVVPLAGKNEEGASLDDRSRSYLHVNCAHCHRETGLGGRAQFQLLRGLTLEETGLLGAKPMIPLPGLENALVLKAGDADRSDLYRRMITKGAGRMPLLGCQKIDEEGARLIREWIEAMKD